MSLYWVLGGVFVLGYAAIAFEHSLHVNKAAFALLTAILLWVALVFGMDASLLHSVTAHTGQALGEAVGQAGGDAGQNAPFVYVTGELHEHLAEVAEILFFLMGAMVIVELIDAHDGFRVITDRIDTTSATRLLWIITILTYFLSSLLDNLTTTIVMVSLLSKLVSEQKMRWYFAAMVVIAANAGGAWSPIGDVTTTMLWIGGQITATGIMFHVFLPSVIATLVPLLLISRKLKGVKIITAHASHTLNYTPPLDMPLGVYVQEVPLPDRIALLYSTLKTTAQNGISDGQRISVLALGLGALAFVPVFKTLTHLPPYVGVLFGLSLMWILTEIMHRHQADFIKDRIGVVGVLTRIDMASILFFLGILLAVAALGSAGMLQHVATWLDNSFGNVYLIDVMIGLLSSIVDNVPLVAGAMKMYPLATDASMAGLNGATAARHVAFLQDGIFWEFLAYCAGTGGSCLIIGSAAGVAAMGMEKIPFMWYFKHITGLAVVGYLAGAAVYVAVEILLH